LPFQLLVEPDGTWLAEHTSVVQSAHPPASILNFAGNGLFVGNPITQEALPFIAEYPVEQAAVRQFAPSETLTGKRANPTEVRQGLAQASLFHFAGHGFFAGEQGGLYLTDGILTAESIRSLDLSRCRLAVLSACLTGMGEQGGSVNSESIVRAFLDAGCSSVLAARWSVDSAATAYFIVKFYSALSRRHNAGLALNDAQNAMGKDSRWAHPFYWAAFQIYS
jgi:CHAT domain-containing protein